MNPVQAAPPLESLLIQRPSHLWHRGGQTQVSAASLRNNFIFLYSTLPSPANKQQRSPQLRVSLIQFSKQNRTRSLRGLTIL
ncbi:hypothetical protein RRG08_009001 [Elysia crispata]|uniref:Uncharacterized protein n=1 Tax=Elysia crispata TaxID=231223 RepID=A0AAE0YU87_9GAST|nr:hypothetical protein RRG08_009001 [Elysia crispata]